MIQKAEGSLISTQSTPQVAKGQSLDLSGLIEQSLAEEITAIKNFGNISATIMKAADDTKANNATNEYLENINALNRELKSMEYDKALEFQDEYQNRAKKLHNDFISKINKLNPQSSEKARERINSFNLGNQEMFSNYVLGEAKKVRNNSFNASITSIRSANMELVTPENAIEKFDETSSIQDKLISDNIVGQGVYNKEFIANSIMQERVELAKQTLQKLNDYNDYGNQMAFVESLSGKIPETERWALGHAVQAKQITFDYNNNPKDFEDEYGNLDINKVNKEAYKYLTTSERELALKHAQKAKTEGISEQEQQWMGELADQLVREDKKIRMSLGWATAADIDDAAKESGRVIEEDIKNYKQKLASDMNERRKEKGTAEALLRARESFLRRANQVYIFNEQTKQWVEAKTEAEANEAKAKGAKVVRNVIDQALDSRYDDYRKIKKMYDNLLFNALYTMKNQSGFKTGWFEGRKLTTGEMVLGQLLSLAEGKAKANNTESYMYMDDVIASYTQLLRTGANAKDGVNNLFEPNTEFDFNNILNKDWSDLNQQQKNKLKLAVAKSVVEVASSNFSDVPAEKMNTWDIDSYFESPTEKMIKKVPENHFLYNLLRRNFFTQGYESAFESVFGKREFKPFFMWLLDKEEERTFIKPKEIIDNPEIAKETETTVTEQETGDNNTPTTEETQTNTEQTEETVEELPEIAEEVTVEGNETPKEETITYVKSNGKPFNEKEVTQIKLVEGMDQVQDVTWKVTKEDMLSPIMMGKIASVDLRTVLDQSNVRFKEGTEYRIAEKNKEVIRVITDLLNYALPNSEMWITSSATGKHSLSKRGHMYGDKFDFATLKKGTEFLLPENIRRVLEEAGVLSKENGSAGYEQRIKGQNTGHYDAVCNADKVQLQIIKDYITKTFNQNYEKDFYYRYTFNEKDIL